MSNSFIYHTCSSLAANHPNLHKSLPQEINKYAYEKTDTTIKKYSNKNNISQELEFEAAY